MGPPETWPQSLVTLLSTGLACPAPMFMGWGPDLIAFFNDSIPVLGGRADETIGRCTRELLSEVWHELGPMIQAALAGESSLAVDLKFDVQACDILGKNWWSFTVSPVRDEDGAVAGFVSMSVNTTEGVLARRNREAAAERLQIALAAGDSIGDWDWDVLMNRVTADSRFALIYNVEPERAAQGVPIEEFLDAMHPEDRPRVQAEIEAAMANRDGFFSEYRILSYSGEEQWISAQGRPIYDDAGRCVRFPGLSFDITANKRAERTRRVASEQVQECRS